MAYIGSSPTKVVSRQSANIFTYQATANQTAFTGSDANGNTLACTPSDIMVHMNGLRLEKSDYVATTTTVTLGSGAAAGDEVTITAFVTFETADAYTKSASDTRYVNTTGDNITGSLGINNATPSFPLHIKGSTNTNAILGVESANWTTGATAELRLAYTAGYNRSIKGHHDNGLQFFTNPTNPSLQIDNSGYVTMPYQPAFMVGNVNQTSPTAGLIVFNQVALNRGNHYSTSNHRFTAPVTAAYHIHFHGFLDTGSTSSGQVEFRINGNSSGWTGVGAIRSYDVNSESGYGPPISLSATVQLSVNDYVDVNTSGIGLHGNQGAYFGGYLIG